MRSPRRRIAAAAAVLGLAIGVFAVAAYAAGSISVGPGEVAPGIETEVNRDVPSSASNAHVPSSHVPRPTTVGVGAGEAGFAGLNHFDQRYGADNGNQGSLVPPDQGLCVGGGTVLEPVNDVFATYDTSGTRTSAPTSLTKFFTGQSEIDRSDPLHPIYGPFVSDPRCYYDPQLGQFFMTALEIDRNPANGAFGKHSEVDIAVSKGSTPSTDAGNWWHYSVDTTNDGTDNTPTHPGCPCFGDQPLIGADEYGFYVSTNEYPITGPGFNGEQLYAFDKAALASGTMKMQYVAGTDGLLPLEEGPAYSLQPATSPAAADWDTSANGTEYLLSSLDFDGTLDNRVAVWALTNTQSLTTGTPDVSLQHVIVSSEVYGQPPDAAQKAGPTPLASVVEQLFGAKNPNSSVSAKEELLAGNDDRMQQAVYAGGELWGALNTVVKTDNGPTHVGSAYFDVHPTVDGEGTLAADMTTQGYVAANQGNVLYPSIGVNHEGRAVYVATLTGTDYYPSAVYTTIDSTGPSELQVSGAGVGPADEFGGYPPFGGPTDRWGDYSAAVADADGNVWVATEYIGQSCSLSEFLADTTCGGTRTILANWGTYITKVTP